MQFAKEGKGFFETLNLLLSLIKAPIKFFFEKDIIIHWVGMLKI